MFYKFVIVYLLLFVSYLAYITAHTTTDHIHAITALIGALGSFLIGVVAAFVNVQNEKTSVVKLENDSEVE
jgi:hypothetical protein